MVKSENVEKAYAVAKERYAELGVDTDAVMEQLKKVKLSMHCWQGDDIHGFFESRAGINWWNWG
jgi:L-rhamnose isomerase